MKVTSRRKYRLGLDLGTNSIGWAAVTLDDQGRPGGVLDMGVRIYPDGRNPTDKTSNAVARRVARGQRRRRDRYLARRGDLMQALMEVGLMPPDAEAREELQRLDPYSLRARALAEPLHPFELGRALFHLNQRRGFKSNRKSGGEEEEDKKKLGTAIEGLRLRIQESGARTLGEFLARRHAQKETVRAREELGLYPERAMYEEEFDSIRQEQGEHHDLSSEQWDMLRNIIFHQRPLRPVDPGWCQFEFESRERRAARALPIFQEFRILQEVNNLRVQIGSEQERPLEEEEREGALKRLRSGKDIDFRKPTRDLRLPSEVSFNLARGGRQKIKGDEVTSRLSKKDLFGSLWNSLSLEERNAIVTFLLDTEDLESVKHKAMEEWGLTELQAKAVAAVSLPTGYGDLSEKAIRKILPHLERGSLYSDAVREAGYSHHSDFRSDAALDRLPYYGEILQRDAIGADPTKDPLKDGEVACYGRFPNPTVHIGLNQLRRVVNRLIEVYGKPEEIAVELARDLKSNHEQRLTYRRRQREGRERNQRFTEMLEAAGQESSPDIFRKLRLWEEQGAPQARVCPYTGRNLSFGMVVSSQTEVDHVLPFSKTLDNSMANKVVCIAAANRDKGDRAPYEAFGHSPPGYDYQKIVDATAKFPANKRWRFREDAMERFEDEAIFLDRQLNETRYLSRTARVYLAHLYDEKSEGRRCVMATPGHLTALLRRAWGLEGILRAAPDTGEMVRKQRDDHRHHAIDAFVVANTTERLLQRFARAAASNHHAAVEKLGSLVPEPWEGFHCEQLRPILDRLVVSYKPDHGTRGVQGQTTGQLHNDTAYGLVELSEDGPSCVVRRKKLSTLKRRSELDAVRDPDMRKALMELWEQVESEIQAEGGKASETPARFAKQAASEGVFLGGRRQIVRRVRVLEKETVMPIRDRSGRPYKGYKRGGNEFADVWRMRDGSWMMVIVPKFEANQPGFDLERFRPVDKSGRKDPTAKRLMRLQINDMGAISEGEERRIVRVRKMTATNTRNLVFLDEHNEADVPSRIVRKELKEHKYSARQLQRSGFRKVGVDEIGRVLDSGPLKS
ncbi:MAG: type II CRISPR RNA-guided endonuclease Cas9 [Caldilineaceae bacterium]|nr:type II CRISPR RNA-guided endonuclease Cas9 [Caldilineaceae bacterium]